MAVPALLKAREWAQWLAFWKPTAQATTGGERLVLDGVTLAHQMTVRDARMLRAPSSLQHDRRDWSEDEWHDPVDAAERDLAWFQRHMPSAEASAPAWAVFLLKALEGVFISRIRLAQQVRQIQRKGYMTLNVSPHSAHTTDFRGDEMG